MNKDEQNNSKSHPWAKLLVGCLTIWIFGWVVGPYVERNVSTYKQIAKIVEERDIDSAAYMYTDAVGSYEGEYYLTDSFKHSNRSDYGYTKAFFSGIFMCFGILGFAWRYVL